MAADPLPIASRVLRDQRRSLVLWSLALAGVTALYTGLYPSMGGTGQMEALVESLPEGLVTAFGYDRIGTPGGWLTSTVYGMLGPILLLVFAIGNGARLVAGDEEEGTLELELTAPVARRRLLAERLAALWVGLVGLVAVVTVVSAAIVVALDMAVSPEGIVAGSTGLLLLVGAFGTVALAIGAATGRRGHALGVAAALAVVAFVFDRLGPTIDAGWMTEVSPFSWYLGGDPLVEGFDPGGLALLAVIPVVAAVLALVRFERRDVGV